MIFYVCGVWLGIATLLATIVEGISGAALASFFGCLLCFVVCLIEDWRWRDLDFDVAPLLR